MLQDHIFASKSHVALTFFHSVRNKEKQFHRWKLRAKRGVGERMKRVYEAVRGFGVKKIFSDLALFVAIVKPFQFLLKSCF